MPRQQLSRAQILSQFLTKQDVAKQVLQTLKSVLEGQGRSWNSMYFIESSAGDGSFTSLLPAKKTVGVEIDPVLLKRHPEFVGADIKQGGFLGLNAKDLGMERVPRSQIVVGFNPPYSVPRFMGRSKNIALDFVNHGAQLGDTVAMILGNTFRRPTTQSKVDRRFHLIYDVDLAPDSFTMDGQDTKVTTIFQIWQAQYDKKGTPIMRPDDPMLRLVKNGEWGGDWRYVKSTDSSANLRVCNWGSHATVGRLDGPKEVKKIVAENQRKLSERIRSGESLKNYDPDHSHYYLCANDPYAAYDEFDSKRYLFGELAVDRTLQHNPDLSHSDVVRIYITPHGTHYTQGKWI